MAGHFLGNDTYVYHFWYIYISSASELSPILDTIKPYEGKAVVKFVYRVKLFN